MPSEDVGKVGCFSTDGLILVTTVPFYFPFPEQHGVTKLSGCSSLLVHFLSFLLFLSFLFWKAMSRKS